MQNVYIENHENLNKKICFKPVIDWIVDAFNFFGYTEIQVVETMPDTDGIFINNPGVFSPLLSKDNEFAIPWGFLSCNTLEELCECRRVMHDLIIQKHTQNGVDIISPETTFISPDAEIGKGTTILPGVVIQGNVKISQGCELGPFTNIRPCVNLKENVKLGAFVEIKNSNMDNGAHVSHLTYIGDSDVGKRVNFGCGTVTVNYNGAKKFRTIIEDDAFIGCNTNLIAPVTIGKGAYTAAGSTITADVPQGLGIARAKQVNKEDWQKPRKDKQ